MFKNTILSLSCAAALGAAALPVVASTTFHLVVPLKVRSSGPVVDPGPGPGSGPIENPSPTPADDISVSLRAGALAPAFLGQAYDQDLKSRLTVTGDPAYDPSLATWQLASGSLPNGLSLGAATGRIQGTLDSTSGSPANFSVKVSYKGSSSQENYQIATEGLQKSCADILARLPGSPSGWYPLDVDGDGPAVPQSYYCDMTSDGGGWTRIVRQTELAPVTNWNGGVNGQSYALATEQIPAHTQTAFGKDEEATFVDYFNYQYTTGVINRTTILGLKTNANYHIARLTNKIYAYGDPDATPYSDCGSQPAADAGRYCGFLVLDRTPGRHYDWAFYPNLKTVVSRGYNMKGIAYNMADSYAWTVWVR